MAISQGEAPSIQAISSFGIDRKDFGATVFPAAIGSASAVHSTLPDNLLLGAYNHRDFGLDFRDLATLRSSADKSRAPFMPAYGTEPKHLTKLRFFPWGQADICAGPLRGVLLTQLGHRRLAAATRSIR
jgi:hypothetical protein